ncbi:MAG: peroxide stress protein YaaA [Nocardiopsaceae bacterium]|nr:peroxide stress protein YaaA [Nocardiopsaceae bacterium]
MLILLPPSEGKATAGGGPPVDLEALTFPELSTAREAVLDTLEELCSGAAETAREVLGLSAAQADAIERNRAVRTASTLRAADLYTGVLYDRLRLPELLNSDSAALVRESVLVFSGLWGVVGATDPLPPYRLSMGLKLPPLGALGAFWRSHLTDMLTKHADDELVVDCRSAAYAAAFKPTGTIAERTVSVRVFRETMRGGTPTRSVVSHMAKAARGAVAHTLLAEHATAQTPRDLAEALNDLGHTTELNDPARKGRPYTLDVIVRNQRGAD